MGRFPEEVVRELVFEEPGKAVQCRGVRAGPEEVLEAEGTAHMDSESMNGFSLFLTIS